MTNTDELDSTTDETPKAAAETAPEVEAPAEESPEGEGADAAPEGAEEFEAPAKEAEPETPEAAADALRDEMEELNDRHLRLVAEFTNYRRRVEQERLEAWGRAQADLVSELLDVLDDLQRVAALDLSNATVEGIMEGIDLVERKFLRKLLDAGAEVIAPETGEPFDPERMEAVMRAPAESEEDDETVAQVFQKGYAFKGQLVRPAKVSVAKHDG